MKRYIGIVGRGHNRSRDMTREEAREAMGLILSGKSSWAQTGAFLLAMRMKGETPEELAGFTDALREHIRPVKVDTTHLLDIANSYDGKTKGLHISPIAGFVAAGAGARLVFHGERGTPPKCGTSVEEVFEGMGVPVGYEADEAAEFLSRTGLCYIASSKYCPRLHEFRQFREDIGLRVSFSVIEKLVNPAGAKSSLVGVFHGPYLESNAGAMRLLGCERGGVVQGQGGSVDVPNDRAVRLAELKDGQVVIRKLDPAELDLGGTPDLSEGAGDPKLNRDIAVDILIRRRKDMDDVVIYNASLMIYLAGVSPTLEEAVDKARHSLESGVAQNALESARSASAA